MFIAAATLALALFAGLGVWFQFDGMARWLALGATGLVGVVILVLAFRGRRTRSLPLLICAFALLAVWWHSIRPSSERDWASDVAHGVTAEGDADTRTISHIRNFTWRSETDFTPRWETRRYDLNTLASVDLISSVWASPAIAHTLMSFGFDDGRHLVFSAEIRRERDEEFSELGGLFKKFELVLIAADERDIVRLRTDIRHETVSLYPLKLDRERARLLFLAYLDKGNALAGTPEYYQTVTTNCTTVIYQLARLVEPTTPWDWRILVSGYLSGYLYKHGLIRTDLPLAEVEARARIMPTGQPADETVDYSERIRAAGR